MDDLVKRRLMITAAHLKELRDGMMRSLKENDIRDGLSCAMLELEVYGVCDTDSIVNAAFAGYEDLKVFIEMLELEIDKLEHMVLDERRC